MSSIRFSVSNSKITITRTYGMQSTSKKGVFIIQVIKTDGSVSYPLNAAYVKLTATVKNTFTVTERDDEQMTKKEENVMKNWSPMSEMQRDERKCPITWSAAAAGLCSRAAVAEIHQEIAKCASASRFRLIVLPRSFD